MHLQLLNRLIPPVLRGDYNSLMRSQLLIGLLLTDIVILLLFFALVLLLPNFVQDKKVLFSISAFVLSHVSILIFFVKSHHLILACHLLLATLSLSIFLALQLTGGFSESVMLQLVFLIPTTAFLLLGLKRGLKWFLLSAAMTVISFFLAKLDIGSVQLLSDSQNQVMNDCLHFLVFLMVSGAIMIYETINEDLKSRLHMEKDKLSYEASHDGLTKIPNRAEFIRRLNQSLLLAQQNESQLVLIYIDLDDFKPVNDTYGHHAGDLLLKTIAKRLQSTIRASDTCARLGGDEFALILSGVSLPQDITLIVNNLLEAIRQPIAIAENNVVVRGSLGVALYPGDADTAEKLCIHADTAMYQAKKVHDSCVFYKDV